MIFFFVSHFFFCMALMEVKRLKALYDFTVSYRNCYTYINELGHTWKIVNAAFVCSDTKNVLG